MEPRTRAYLRGRFRDHYRRQAPSLPPAANEREWGFIPWSEGSTTMVRHRSMLDLGDLGDFLARKRPRHVYFSAGRYRDPGAGTMSEKDWQDADLVFDLDADHLPRVDPERDNYGEMLSTCKDALVRLLSFLEDDFGFNDLSIVFSGSRGYHVHVRDEAVRRLGREARREIVDYVRGVGIDFERVVESEPVGGMGRETPAQKRSLSTTGGWSRRVHRRVDAVVDELLSMDDADAIDRLRSYEGIGEGKANAILTAAASNREAIAAGNIDIHPAFISLVRTLVNDTVEREIAPIDEPVTTDLNRLIRLPGSLHGGTGLAVRPIDREQLEAFDPLVDAVPSTFESQEIAVSVTDPGTVDLGGDTFTVSAGPETLPEYVGIFLMARGRAEKEKE
jgi:DNA primase small subunit